ncbi:pyocin knob domain-containing protein [Pseudomonas wadenswilerensis]|uniref:Phage tail protein C-terminal domain-containing protein n=1 Tax=Pseudomonas wadenswilerensis TaxID=1785161 RepID=A0A380SXH4_9PSED|nr:pyocin knob domain-containing protein [Pseudomonas wadenswilerensis]SUQ62712.1 hypothetical protein CCOS864_02158 [Pseudomonas wadenswilerensis]
MPWYRTGSVAITAGQQTVTGTGTAFSANSRVGDAFQGPDGRWYEVTNIASAAVLSIYPAYQGATVTGGAYGLAPMQGYVKDAADKLRQIVEQWGATLAGLGSVSTEDVVPVAKGGTGGKTQAEARNGLGLGNAAVATIGTAAGQVLTRGAFGLGATWATGLPLATNIGGPQIQDSGFYRYSPATADKPGFGSGYGTLSALSATVDGAGNYGTQLAIDYAVNAIGFRRLTGPAWGGWCEIYHTGNTTRGSGGALSAASPIVRIANVSDSARRDLQEQTFQGAGAWGVANDEARGVQVERMAMGEYRIAGSLGLAVEGWRTQDPCSPDGGRPLGITESEQGDDGTVTVRLFKQRWTLTDDGELLLSKGVPLDVPLNSWIDVRLDMPPPPTPRTEP